jgi:hypothetical protein
MFVVVIPFSNVTYYLLLHFVCIPFLVVHWILNNNTCVLTLFEKIIRKQVTGTVDTNECFTCQLIEPVYDFTNSYDAFDKIIYIVTISLWMMVAYKIYKKYCNGNIKSLKDIFSINI